MKRVNESRKAEKYKRNFKGPFEGYDHAQTIASMECLVTVEAAAGVPEEPQCSEKIEAAHLFPRGMGGCGGSWEVLVALCTYHHGVLDGRFANRPQQFGRYYGVDVLTWAEGSAATVKAIYGESLL